MNGRKNNLQIEMAMKAKKNVEPSISILNKTFKYRHLKETEIISVQAIHAIICKKHKKGEKKGKLIGSRPGEYQVDYDDKKAVEVKQAIYNLLDTYEYIGSGVYQNVFDELIIYDLFSGMIERAYDAFEKYIKHVNIDMLHDEEELGWINLKTLALQYKISQDKIKISKTN